MTPGIRLWLAFGALGAGLIHLAVGASAPLVLAIVLVGFGAAELGWGVATLGRGRLLARRVALVAGLVPVFVWAAAAGGGLGVPAGATGLPLYPMAVASFFDIFLAGALAVIQRRSGRASTPAPAPEGRRFLIALLVGGVLFSGLTTPALAATDAGLTAVPHGSHSVPGLEVPGRGHSH